MQADPRIAAIADDLGAYVAPVVPRGHLESIASLAVVLDIEGREIAADGCLPARAHSFAQIKNRLHDLLCDLDIEECGTVAREYLMSAARLQSALLALAEPAGHA